MSRAGDIQIEPDSRAADAGPTLARAVRQGSGTSTRGSLVRTAGRRLSRWWAWNVKSVPFAALGLGLTALVTGTWTADVLKGAGVFEGWGEGAFRWQIPLRIAVVVLFLFASWALYLRRRDLMGVGAVSEAPVEPRTALIIPVSPVFEEVTAHGPGVRITGTHNGEVTVVELAGSDIGHDIDELDQLHRWPWQQLLRAVRPHRESLRYVYLLGSLGKGGSAGQTGAAAALIRPYLAPETKLLFAVADFDNMTAMMKCMAGAIQHLTTLRDGEGGLVPEHEIIIDVTGGLKPTSIAGAAMTLSRNVTFQYVHTRTGKVREFDLLQKSASF